MEVSTRRGVPANDSGCIHFQACIKQMALSTLAWRVTTLGWFSKGPEGRVAMFPDLKMKQPSWRASFDREAVSHCTDRDNISRMPLT
jgi:hypothetical protein